MTCRKCTTLPEDAVFCHLCGVKQAKPASRPRTRANGLGGTVKLSSQLAAGNSLDCQPAASSLQSRTSG